MKVRGLTVVSLQDTDGAVWFAVGGEDDIFTCTVGDRTMHIDELAPDRKVPCPRDTDGDGNCGKSACPHCGIYGARSKRDITRADITIHGSAEKGLMMICMKCAATFQSRGYKVSAVDEAADAHIEQHEDPRLSMGG